MPRFEVVGLGRETGRKRVRIYEARNEDEAIMMAASDGTIVEKNKIFILPEIPPTESQINYAKDLGIKLKKNMSRKELSELIHKAEEEDWPRKKTIRRAQILKIDIPENITDDDLEDLIDERENQIEDEKEEQREKREDEKFYAAAKSSQPKHWNRGIAFIFSFFIPGLGQMYKGRILRGIVWFILVGFGYYFFDTHGAILHLCCVIGAAFGNPYK